MPGLFQSLELGKRALLTHQMSMQTVGHNIANVNTAGYRRQRVTVTTTLPDVQTYGILGTGIKATDVRHMRDLFLGNQFRQNNKSLGQWTEPENASYREAVLEQSNLLVNGLHEMARQLTALQDSVDRDLVNLTTEVNRLAKEIGRLNHDIKRSELGSVQANDLRDYRDVLIDQLSGIIDVNTSKNDDGSMIVYIGAMALVDADKVLSIDTEIINDKGTIKHELVWAGTSLSFKNLNGQIKGLLESRDVIIPDYLEKLDQIARTLVEEVNSLHRSGYGLDNSTGINFFDSRFMTATTIRISDVVLNDTDKIAAASLQDSVGDNTTALALYELRNQLIMKGNSITMNDFYNSLVGTLGVETREAQSFTDNYELLGHQINNARQSVEGVSLDEEMANLVKFQHAYDAAARVITAVDQALDTVIHGMGIVGR
jgi:flagellar hook-associated protein 1 FlgK